MFPWLALVDFELDVDKFNSAVDLLNFTVLLFNFDVDSFNFGVDVFNSATRGTAAAELGPTRAEKRSCIRILGGLDNNGTRKKSAFFLSDPSPIIAIGNACQ